MMRFKSTRGAQGATFGEALRSGLAPDGGLYVPATIPQAPAEWRSKNRLEDLALAVLRPYLEADVARSALAHGLRKALNFPVPLVAVDAQEKLYVLELFHGPTLSFKDVGARTMARLLRIMAERERLTILVATSGDTGSAVADGFAAQDGIRVALLFPEGQVSPTQALQLTLARPGVRAFAVRGTFDECQAMVKAALANPKGLNLSAANSINVGRLLPQMVYYFWAFVQGGFDEAVVSVPCGNLGNLTAGILAALAGLPIRRFLAAHNANGAFPHYLATGQSTFGPSLRTLSNAMDVGAPSNFERLQHLMPDMKKRITGYSVSDEETLASMRRVFARTGYMADPHTAVGLEAVRRYRQAAGLRVPAVVLATAHPAKFPATVRRALGRTPAMPAALADLARRARRVEPLQSDRAALMDVLHSWE